MIISLFDRVENTVGEGPAFSPFATVFSKAFFIRVVESRDDVAKRFISVSTKEAVALYFLNPFLNDKF